MTLTIAGDYEQAEVKFDEVWQLQVSFDPSVHTHTLHTYTCTHIHRHTRTRTHMQKQPVGVGLVFGALNPVSDPFKVSAFSV